MPTTPSSKTKITDLSQALAMAKLPEGVEKVKEMMRKSEESKMLEQRITLLTQAEMELTDICYAYRAQRLKQPKVVNNMEQEICRNLVTYTIKKIEAQINRAAESKKEQELLEEASHALDRALYFCAKIQDKLQDKLFAPSPSPSALRDQLAALQELIHTKQQKLNKPEPSAPSDQEPAITDEAITEACNQLTELRTEIRKLKPELTTLIDRPEYNKAFELNHTRDKKTSPTNQFNHELYRLYEYVRAHHARYWHLKTQANALEKQIIGSKLKQLENQIAGFKEQVTTFKLKQPDEQTKAIFRLEQLKEQTAAFKQQIAGFKERTAEFEKRITVLDNKQTSIFEEQIAAYNKEALSFEKQIAALKGEKQTSALKKKMVTLTAGQEEAEKQIAVRTVKLEKLRQQTAAFTFKLKELQKQIAPLDEEERELDRYLHTQSEQLESQITEADRREHTSQRLKELLAALELQHRKNGGTESKSSAPESSSSTTDGGFFPRPKRRFFTRSAPRDIPAPAAAATSGSASTATTAANTPDSTPASTPESSPELSGRRSGPSPRLGPSETDS